MATANLPRVALMILPPLRQRVHSFTRVGTPSTSARTFWMLGLNLRIVRPVQRRPTPPFFLGRPRRATMLPPSVRLLQIEQTRAMGDSNSARGKGPKGRPSGD